VYVFGGGVSASYDHVLSYDPATGMVSRAGTLPTPASDVAVTAIGNTAYVVGGYTGASPLATILAWTPGAAPRVVGHLPQAVRYAAVAPAGSRLIIIGGTVAGAASNRILSFDTSSGKTVQIGTLPTALTHSSAATLGGLVIVVGGRREEGGGQTDTVLAVNPTTGAVRTVGHLPRPLSDAPTATLGDRILVAGGDTGNGPEAAILAISPGA
jgi:N-acetylneuraminic acid mutarotase